MLAWRVEYALWAAGGGLIPTSVEVTAETAQQAIDEAQRLQKRHDQLANRANTGYWGRVIATLALIEEPTPQGEAHGHR